MHRLVVPLDWKLPDVFRKRLGRQAGRQRAMFADGHLLLILHKPPKPEDLHRFGRLFWRKPTGQWESSDLGDETRSLRRHLEEFSQVIEKLDSRIDSATGASEYFEVLNDLAPVRRAARNLHEALQKAREHVPDDTDIIDLRDQAYQLSRSADLLYSDGKNGLDYEIAKRSEEAARNSEETETYAHRLNILAAFFLPMMTLTAIFGMNLKSGLEDLPTPAAFGLVLLLGFLAGFVLKAVITRPPKT